MSAKICKCTFVSDIQDKLGEIYLSDDGISQSIPIVLPIFDGQKAHIAGWCLTIQILL